MSNIIEYVKWRGDLSIKQSPFNEVDNLILSMFSYLSIENIMWDDSKITINEIYRRAESVGIPENTFFHKENAKLLKILAYSERFGSLYITQPISKIDETQQKQFYAVTILLPDNTIYVSYRGTDNNLIGWKEDFNMAFSSQIPSQKDAVKYLEKIAKTTKKKIRLGGHSKGGNLAIYAATFCSADVKKRIIDVYNNDGPGMNYEIINRKEYREIVKRVHTYIPQSSVIGRLLYHKEKYIIVQSLQKGIMQHDPYSWQVLNKEFITLTELTNESDITDKVIKDWLESVNPEKREQFIDVIYQILTKTNINSVDKLGDNWIKTSTILLKTYTTIDEESKKIISEALEQIFKITRKNILKSIPMTTIKKKKYNKKS